MDWEGPSMATRALFLLVACKSRLGTTCQAPETGEIFLHAFILLPASFLEQVGGEDGCSGLLLGLL